MDKVPVLKEPASWMGDDQKKSKAAGKPVFVCSVHVGIPAPRTISGT